MKKYELKLQIRCHFHQLNRIEKIKISGTIQYLGRQLTLLEKLQITTTSLEGIQALPFKVNTHLLAQQFHF